MNQDHTDKDLPRIKQNRRKHKKTEEQKKMKGSRPNKISQI